MRRSLLATVLLLLTLTACGTDDDVAVAASSSSASRSPSTAEEYEESVELTPGDVETCEEFVAGEDRVVEFLTAVQDTGSVYDDPDGQRPLATLADRAQPYLEVAEHPDLVLPLERLVALDADARRAIVSGQLDPEPHLNSLQYAADLCEYGGVDIDWHA